MTVVSAVLTRGCVLAVVLLGLCLHCVLQSEVVDDRSDETPLVKITCVRSRRQSVARLLDLGRLVLGWAERGRDERNVHRIEFGCGQECAGEQGGRGTGQIHASTA